MTMIKVLIFAVCLSVSLFFVTCEEVKEQEASCEWLGIQGKCVPKRRCLTSLDTRSEKQPACPSKGDEATICCTDCELVNDTSNYIMTPSMGAFWKDGRKARDACLQYIKDVPNKCAQEGYYSGLTRQLNEELKCHIYSMWGIGGSPGPCSESPSENPYEALIGYGNDLETTVWRTSGAIISEKFIITFAHGQSGPISENPPNFVALGVKNRKRVHYMRNWQIHKVKTVHQHPEFDNRYNDIALVELETPITFNYDVLPACLPEPTEDFDITEAKFSLWKDETSKPESFLDMARILKVKELTAEECDVNITEAEAPTPTAYNKYLPQKVKADSQLCYGTTETCLNVIGGPLAVTTQYSRCMNTVIGVNAYGHSCGSTVFTKVKNYVSWIEGIVWPSQ